MKFLNEIATKIAVRFQNMKDEAGQTLVEYGLIVALISIVAITALALVGSNVSAVFDDGWGTQGTARWSHVYTEPDDCEDPTVSRLSGSDRFAAAVAISEKSFDSGVDVVYVANGLNFPDALAA